MGPKNLACALQELGKRLPGVDSVEKLMPSGWSPFRKWNATSVGSIRAVARKEEYHAADRVRTRDIARRDDGYSRQVIGETKRAEYLPRPRPYADARPDFSEGVGGLVNVDLNVMVTREGNGTDEATDSTSADMRERGQ